MNFFRPDLTLSEDLGAAFALNTTTLVPTVAYVISGARPQVSPKGVKLASDIFPVLLHARKHHVGDVGHPVLRNHRVPKLDLAGKASVFAFVCMEDDTHFENVLGCATSHVVRALPKLSEGESARASDWQVCVLPNREGATLHVAGLVFTPTPGFTVTLAAKAPQGINPKELLLDLIVTPKSGRWPQSVTPHTVQFQQKLRSLTDVTGVTIVDAKGDATVLTVTPGA